MALMFDGDMPGYYHTVMGPKQFLPFAHESAARVARWAPARVLEIAAGTGIVTRALRQALPSGCAITATDISKPMLDYAARALSGTDVAFEVADVMALPFEAGAFDCVVCQFGAMLFADRAAGFAEMRRVLIPGRRALVVVWNGIERNDFQLAMEGALAAAFPDDPPDHARRVPFGYADPDAIRADCTAGGFRRVAIDTVTRLAMSGEAEAYVAGWLRGSPTGREVLARDPDHGMARAEAACVAAMREQFPPGTAIQWEAMYVTLS